ncbi:MAG: MFS transporter [Acidobacteriota bacterium]|nr:MFS transporter [Acidobacteriota bacterium]
MKRRDGPWVLAATILGSSMAFIDGTVVNVALPAILGDFHATMVGAQWVVEAYALFLAALLLAGGSLGDRLGRRRVFSAGVVLFAAASAGCGLAASLPQLVVARAVQGVGGALLVPGSLAILSGSFPASERGRAIGTWSGFTAITAAIGPVLGGWLIDHLSWRWAFFVNIPLAAAALAITVWRVPESRDDKEVGPFDWAGALLATIGLGGIVFALIESSELGWRDPRVLGALAGGLLSLGAFAVVERSAKNPMMPLRLFTSRNFTGANVLTLFLYGALASVFFLIPLDLIQVQGYTAAAAGAAVLPFILLMFLLSRWSGGLVHRFGAKGPLVAGPLVAAGGLALFAVPGVGGSYWTTFFPAMVVLGLGMATSVAPLTTTVMSAVDRRHAGIASGINNAVSRTAGLLSVAILSAVMLQAFGKALESRLAGARVSPSVRAAIDSQRTRLAAIRLPAETEGREAARVKAAISASFVSGFRLVMLMASGLSALAAVAAFVWIDGKKVER